MPVAEKQSYCMSCGGEVDHTGRAMGGEVDTDNQDPDGMYDVGEAPPNDENESSQMASADDIDAKARKAFIRAVRSR